MMVAEPKKNVGSHATVGVPRKWRNSSIEDAIRSHCILQVGPREVERLLGIIVSAEPEHRVQVDAGEGPGVLRDDCGWVRIPSVAGVTVTSLEL